jgi:hypothetical protein
MTRRKLLDNLYNLIYNESHFKMNKQFIGLIGGLIGFGGIGYGANMIRQIYELENQQVATKFEIDKQQLVKQNELQKQEYENKLDSQKQEFTIKIQRYEFLLEQKEIEKQRILLEKKEMEKKSSWNPFSN